MRYRSLTRVAALAALAISVTACGGVPDPPATPDAVEIIDLSHQLTTFEPKPGAAATDRFAADLTKPVDGSQVVAAFSDQMVIVADPDFPTGDGVFKLNTTVLPENLGTSIDAGGHFLANRPTVANPDQRGLADLTVEDLTGPVVVIDISQRVDAELSKNDGSPGPVEVTNFGSASASVVTAADIDAIADQLEARTWVIVNTGWSQFYWNSGPGQQGPYVNGFNYPGFSEAAIARLIEIETSRGIRINGIGADNLTVDAGDATGAPDFAAGAFPAHRYGLARGWKMLENLANTAAISTGKCTLFVGAMNHRGGVAGWARIFARCVR
ncbi:MAG: cyclase family protein [Pseudomonadales bacterium]